MGPERLSTRAAWINEVRPDGVIVPVCGEDVETSTTPNTSSGSAAPVPSTTRQEDHQGRRRAALHRWCEVRGSLPAETCTGDSARRAGNEFLFQMLAGQNIEQLYEVFDGVPPKQRKIVVTCAHCFNTFGNEYPELGGQYEVVHHTQLLNKLVRANRLQPVASRPEPRGHLPRPLLPGSPQQGL